jgi:sec-independent protein translocase protein TatC
VTVATLKGIRPYVIVASFVIAAIITPPDPGSMMLLAVPLVLLYEVGLLVARFVRVGDRRSESTAST